MPDSESQATGEILLDADVLLIDIRFPRDANFAVNQQVLEWLRSEHRTLGITAQALLEVVGILSFNVFPHAECLLTWNARHYIGKLVIPVFTPQEWLAQQPAPTS